MFTNVVGEGYFDDVASQGARLKSLPLDDKKRCSVCLLLGCRPKNILSPSILYNTSSLCHSWEARAPPLFRKIDTGEAAELGGAQPR